MNFFAEFSENRKLAGEVTSGATRAATPNDDSTAWRRTGGEGGEEKEGKRRRRRSSEDCVTRSAWFRTSVPSVHAFPFLHRAGL